MAVVTRGGHGVGQADAFKDVARGKCRVARDNAQPLVGDIGGEVFAVVGVIRVKAVFAHGLRKMARRVVVAEVVDAKVVKEVIQRGQHVMAVFAPRLNAAVAT